MKNRRAADIWLLFITFLWGFSFLVVKGALSYSGPYWFLFLRFTLAAIAMVVFFPGVLGRLDRQALWTGGGLACVLYAGFILQTAGLVYTTPAKSAFITGVSVVLVPLFGRIVFRNPLTREVVIGILIAFAGLYLLTKPDDLGKINRGDVLTLGCAIVFAFHILLVGRWANRAEPMSMTFVQIVGAALCSLPFALSIDGASYAHPWRYYLAVVYLSIFCSAFALSVQIRAQRQVPPSRAALIFSLEPVFAALASLIFYGENLLAREWLGGFLVVVGVIVGEATVLRSKYGTSPAPERINQCQKELR